MTAPVIWMLLTQPGTAGVAVPLMAEIGEGTRGIGLRRADMRDASADLEESAETGAKRTAEILYREKYIQHHLVVRYAADAELFNVHGRSADLAFALALASAVQAAHGLDGDVPPVLAATGTLDEEGQVRKIEGVAGKLALALSHLPERSIFVFPRENESDLPPDARVRAAERGIALVPVAQLEEAVRLLGFAVFRRDGAEFRLWHDLSREAEQWSRGERALIPAGPQLEAARALYARRADDWNLGDDRILSYIRASLAQRDRRRVVMGLALAIPSVLAAGAAARAAYDYVENLHRTRIAFGDIAVPPPDYRVAAAPYLKRYGISIASFDPARAAVIIMSNIGFYRGAAVNPISSEHFLTAEADPIAAPISYTLRFARPAKEVRLLRAALWAASPSGVTHPAWVAHAFDSEGREIASGGEKLLGSFKTIDANWIVLPAPTGKMIEGLTISSDCRKQGRYFAGAQAALIQEIQLLN
ncbi:MAG TPA: hypothetical protein VMD53_08330 [Rhizomicrobium sp.]|nr:hypothetical protein [Rhizomicrobium sp.]